MQPAIRVEQISKQYRLGVGPAKGNNLTENLRLQAKNTWDKLRRLARPNAAPPEAESFWALRDVSFDVQPGEVVGIIGRNGAGKSTLLKILSQIVEPTSGHAEVRGRMGSLLEVGTGFHPELTGRENMYLNGCILGMSRREINQKFDEIVAFAEMDKFLDTPVKRYSSGMYVRLAFAVAAHLEPEILVVDEVLAVGDATFQRKCIERLSDLARSGRTVLFVSHNLDIVNRICKSAVLLEHGVAIRCGPAEEVVRYYLDRQLGDAESQDLSTRHRTGDGRARFTRYWLESGDGRSIVSHTSGEDLTVCAEIDSPCSIDKLALAVVLKSVSSARLITSWTEEVGYTGYLKPGRQVYRCKFHHVALRPGQRIIVELWMESNGVLDHVSDAGIFDVIDSPTTKLLSSDPHQGAVLCPNEWERGRD